MLYIIQVLGDACFERSGCLANVRFVTLTAFYGIDDSSVFTSERFFVFGDNKVCLAFFIVNCLGYSHVGAEFATLVGTFFHWECPREEFV